MKKSLRRANLLESNPRLNPKSQKYVWNTTSFDQIEKKIQKIVSSASQNSKKKDKI
jgi:hypothetical protein